MTKYQAYQHLIDSHGQLWPETAKGWRRDEVDWTHRDHHRAGRVTEPHNHDAAGHAYVVHHFAEITRDGKITVRAVGG